MIEPDRRSESEVEAMAEGVELETSEAMQEAAADAGREYIHKMLDAGNDVIQNPYGEAIIEIVVPKDQHEAVSEIVEEWDLNPSGHGIMAQPPSFSEDRPEVSKGLVAWQMMLTDDEGEELNSCGYDVESIVSDIQDEEIDLLMTKAPRVQCSLPVE
jgi:hypothetical protein